jgi:uncharacterized protein
MIDLAAVSGFEWDAGNARKSVDKHGVRQMETEQVFFNDPLLLLVDEKHSGAEARFHGLGASNEGRRLHVTFTLRAGGTMIRVISARAMSAKERAAYDQTT